MAINTTPADNYPFATKDGSVIPLDIVRPVSFSFVELLPNASMSFELDSRTNVFVFSSTIDCVIGQKAALLPLTANVTIDSGLFIPAGVLVTAIMDVKTVHVIASRIGSLRVQAIVQWAGLSLESTYTRR